MRHDRGSDAGIETVSLLPSSIYTPIKNDAATAIIGALHIEERRILTTSIRIPFQTT